MNFRVIHDSNIPCFFQIFNYPLGKLTFIANFIPYIAGLMRQISTFLITEIYASMIDFFFFFFDFFIFFAIDSLVLP